MISALKSDSPLRFPKLGTDDGITDFPVGLHMEKGNAEGAIQDHPILHHVTRIVFRARDVQVRWSAGTLPWFCQFFERLGLSFLDPAIDSPIN